MKRVVSVWLPHWPIDRLKRASRLGRLPNGALPDDSTPFALTASGQKGIRLSAVNKVALDYGLRPAMALADARAILPSLHTLTADPESDARALHKLALWCTRYTPWTNINGADGLWLDISGCAHLWGGEDALLDDLHTRLDVLGLSNRLGLADTAGAAWAQARFATLSCLADGIVRPNGSSEALKPLPVESLRLTPSVVVVLNRLGLKTIGELYHIPRAALARRFNSSELCKTVLIRLDQALGERDEPISPLIPAPLYRSRTAFADPVVEIEFIRKVLSDLLDNLCRALAQEQKGARKLTLTACRVDGSATSLTIGTSAPSRHPDHLAYLFKEKLCDLDPAFGIDALILSADAIDPLGTEQHSFHKGGPIAVDQTKSLAQLVDRLTNNLGFDTVQQTHFQESHIPERADRRQPALSASSTWPAASEQNPPRPFRLLSQPESIQVTAEIPEGPPLIFTWRRLTRRVARAEGPERIMPEWWLDHEGDDVQIRDYYRIEDIEGHRYWVFREGLYQDQTRQGPPHWYIHGLFA